MINILIYLKSNKKPFEISFQSSKVYDKFIEQLLDESIRIINVGPLTFMKEEFSYCLQK